MNRILRATLASAITVLAAGKARADIVVLQNGVKMEGILFVDEDHNQTLEVSEDGFVVLDTATVVEIRHQSRKENAKIIAQWENDGREAADKVKFAASQRARGLILLDGDWVTVDEYDRELAREKLEIERTKANHPRVRRATAVYRESRHSGGTTFYGSAFAPSRKLDYSYTTQPLYGASGNFIRKSEFVSPTSAFGHGGKYFDPSTGLYR